jgi:DNA-binding GntR family transcriptional regulator
MLASGEATPAGTDTGAMDRQLTGTELLDAESPGYRRVAARLRQEILDGIIPAGDWLRLQSIAERCEVSTQPVREALQQLEGEGLVRIHPNRGAQVRGIDRQRLINIFEIREAVEAMLVAKFCEECSLSEIRRIEAVQRRHDEATLVRDRTATSAANWEFHHLINAGAGNEDARLLVERYYDLYRSLHRSLPVEELDYDRVREEHQRLIDAFHRRDVAAAREVSALHVRGTLEALLHTERF